MNDFYEEFGSDPRIHYFEKFRLKLKELLMLEVKHPEEKLIEEMSLSPHRLMAKNEPKIFSSPRLTKIDSLYVGNAIIEKAKQHLKKKKKKVISLSIYIYIYGIYRK